MGTKGAAHLVGRNLNLPEATENRYELDGGWGRGQCLLRPW